MHIYNEYVIVTGDANNNSDYPVQQVTYNNRLGNATMMFPFGFYANVKVGSSMGLLTHIKGQEDNVACLSANTPQLRPRDLENGELALFHPDTGTFIKFRNNGNLEIDTGNGQGGDVVINCQRANINASHSVNVDTPDANFTGNINVDGNAVCGGTMQVDSTFNCDGAATLGGAGGQPIARVGDSVLVGGVTGAITTGSAIHKAT